MQSVDKHPTTPLRHSSSLRALSCGARVQEPLLHRNHPAMRMHRWQSPLILASSRSIQPGVHCVACQSSGSGLPRTTSQLQSALAQQSSTFSGLMRPLGPAGCYVPCKHLPSTMKTRMMPSATPSFPHQQMATMCSAITDQMHTREQLWLIRCSGVGAAIVWRYRFGGTHQGKKTPVPTPSLLEIDRASPTYCVLTPGQTTSQTLRSLVRQCNSCRPNLS